MTSSQQPGVRIFDEIGVETRDFLDLHKVSCVEDLHPLQERALQELYLAKLAPLRWLLPALRIRAISDNMIFSPFGNPLMDEDGFVVGRAAYACGDLVEVSVAPYYEVTQASNKLGAMIVLEGMMIDEGMRGCGQLAVPLDGRADISFTTKLPLDN